MSARGAGLMPGIGVSLSLMAVGAILRFAVTATVAGLDLITVGLILMIVGAVGLVISVFSVVLHARGMNGTRSSAPPIRDRQMYK